MVGIYIYSTLLLLLLLFQKEVGGGVSDLLPMYQVKPLLREDLNIAIVLDFLEFSALTRNQCNMIFFCKLGVTSRQ